MNIDHNDNKQLYWVWLSERFGVASKQFAAFAYTFRDPFDVYNMSDEEIEHIDGISSRTKDRLCNKSLDAAYATLRYCQENGVEIIDFYSESYPERLKNIENPPVLLYCRGKLPDMNSRLCIAAVGTRKISEYGRQSAYKISYELASAGVCIVSGMASGVDGVCAVGALEAHGNTVAVLGCGVDKVYPREHAHLMQRIMKSGAVISEFPPNTPPRAENFPIRNRIISGMAQGTLVVEAPERSGALITAKKAISQGRDVFALPGKIDDDTSRGPNDLIRAGANIALGSQDIIDHYDFLYHTVLDYGALTRARLCSDLRAEVLADYGVCTADKGAADKGATDKGATDKGAAGRGAAGKAERGAQKRAKPSSNSSAKLAATRQQTSAAEQESGAAEQESTASEKRAVPPNYELLDWKTQRVYDRIGDEPFSPDTLTSPDEGIREIMTALTLLEISGLLVSCPGGMFKKV